MYPLDYLPTINKAQTAIIDTFIAGLESALQVKRTEISLAQCWEEDMPDGPTHSNIEKYLLTVCHAKQLGCVTLLMMNAGRCLPLFPRRILRT